MGFIKEFKEFAMKGSLVDIAVAFVMGAAFGKVITSFTEGIVAPLIGMIGGADLTANMYTLKEAVLDATGKVVTEAVAIKWGDFAVFDVDRKPDRLATVFVDQDIAVGAEFTRKFLKR